MENTPTPEAVAALAELNRRVRERLDRGMHRDRALMITVMEMQGKITIVKG